jgi:hypothetical protein
VDGAGADRERGVMSPDEKEKLPWYFRNSTVIIAVLSFGPLALPLIWLHPKMTGTKKILWTVVVLVSAYFLYLATMDAMKKFETTYQELKTIL